MPTGDITKHDIVINGRGYMRETVAKPPIEDADGQPGIARSAGGEGRYDYYTVDAFHAMVSVAGGLGQARQVAADKALTGVGRGEHHGQMFPAMKILHETEGGSESWYFRIGATLYGFGDETITKIGSSSTWSRPAGAVLQQPVVSNNGNAFWVQENEDAGPGDPEKILVRWAGEGTAAEDITMYGYLPMHVANYGRHLFQFAERDLPTEVDVIQSAVAMHYVPPIGGGSQFPISAAWDTPTTPGNMLMAALIETPHSNSHLDWVEATDPTWGTEVFEAGRNFSGGPSIKLFTIPNAPPREGVETFQFIVPGSGATTVALVLLEVSGLRKSAYPEQAHGGINTTANLETRTLDYASTGSFRVVFAGRKHANAVTPGPDWTEIIDKVLDTSDDDLRVNVAWSTTETSHSYNGTSAAFAYIIASFPKSNITIPMKQLVVLGTDDDGQNWEPAPGGISTGELGNIRATRAADEQLYIATDRGLWAMTYGEQEYGPDTRLNVTITGKLDEWEIPPDDNLGKHMAVYDNGIYFPVGGSLRRFVRGIVGPAERLIWPRDEWSTTSGNIQAMVSGENGLMFGAGGFLWNYNGRGFQAHAIEPADPEDGTFDYLFWHNGRLYMQGNPAPYLDYGYPNMRPDQISTDSARYTTAAYISSSLDFDKVDMRKFIRKFQTHARFTTESNSGKVTLQYLQGCTVNADPGRIGGMADSLSWVTVGEHTRSDGYVNTYNLSSPIICYRLYLRVLIEVGTEGYPIFEGATVYGRCEMPNTRIFSPVLEISTSVREKLPSGAQLYPDLSDVESELDILAALRTATPFKVIFDDDGSGGEELLMTCISYTRSKQEDARASSASKWTVQLVLAEVP